LQLEGLDKLKNQMTTPGIEPATLQLVAKIIYISSSK
jgi:hypothetical protein